MKIVTWNINSVRLRADGVLSFLKKNNPDILCLQETKCPDEFFPHDVFENAGYRYRAINGMKSYNGVAIISKLPLSDIGTVSHCGKNDCRHIFAKIKSGKTQFELHNIYIPAGGPEPDPDLNPSFRHKLDFTASLAQWFAKNRRKSDAMIAVGDFNIAPFENDVWSHKQLLNVVSHTPVEVAWLEKFKNSLGWIDVAREFVPHNEKLYTWWSYRNRDWQKSNRGRRLDHIWVTQSVKNKIKDHNVYREERAKCLPSDHVPVELSLF